MRHFNTTSGSQYFRSLLGPFFALNMAAAQTDNTTISFATGLGATVRVYKALRPMAVTGISIYLNTVNAAPAGSITISIFKNGVDTGATYDITLTPSGAADQGTTKRYSPALQVAEGDTIDFRFSTTADWNSTTGDIVGFVEVEM